MGRHSHIIWVLQAFVLAMSLDTVAAARMVYCFSAVRLLPGSGADFHVDHVFSPRIRFPQPDLPPMTVESGLECQVSRFTAPRMQTNSGGMDACLGAPPKSYSPSFVSTRTVSDMSYPSLRMRGDERSFYRDTNDALSPFHAIFHANEGSSPLHQRQQQQEEEGLQLEEIHSAQVHSDDSAEGINLG